MKKKIILYVGALILSLKVHAQPIVTDIFGQNLWALNINNVTDPTSVIAYLPQAAAAGVKTVRIGGIWPNWNPIIGTNLITLINAIQSAGMKVIIQVSFNPFNGISQTTQAQAALNLVNFVNTPPNSKNVTDWIISNEPDGAKTTLPANPWGFGWDGSATPGSDIANIKSYINEFSAKMNLTTGPAINIIGPELKTYFPLYNISNGLLTDATNNILGDIDEFSFHVYPTAPVNCSSPCTTSRASLIAYPSGPFLQKLQDITFLLAGNPKKISITEFNSTSCDNFCASGDVIGGVDPRSYLSGQFIAEMFCIGMGYNNGQVSHMNVWGMKEGQPDRGFLRDFDGKPRSSFHHFSLVANNFRDQFLSNTYTGNSGTHKMFAYKNTSVPIPGNSNPNEIGVLIMNQDQTYPAGTNYGSNFTINFDGTNPTGNFGANFGNLITSGAPFTCYIKAETTVLLKFNATTGALISRTEYSIEDARNDVGPKTWTPAGTDAYIRDTPNDDGNEPNPEDPWNIVNGTDVWVRNTADQLQPGFTDRFQNEHQHQSPVWTTNWQTNASSRPVIYVKVRNRSCNAVTGTVHLYFVRAGLNDHWDNFNVTSPGAWGSWEEIFNEDADGNGAIDNGEPPSTSQTINLPPGQETVVQVVWNNTQNQSQFTQPTSSQNEWCLLARFDGGNDPIITSGSLAEQPGVSAAGNAQKQNNIVQKNVVFTCPGCKCYSIDFGNLSNQRTNNKLVIADYGDTEFTPEEGKVRIDLGETVFRQWVRGGMIGDGIVSGKEKYLHTSPNGVSHTHEFTKPDPYKHEIQLNRSTGTIENINLDPGLIPLCVNINYFTTQTRPATYKKQLRQFETFVAGQTYSFTGAVTMIIEKPACEQVNAGTDQKIGKRCPAVLSASFTDSAAYVWRNNLNGSQIATTRTVQVNPKLTTSYEVEMTTPNNCISYGIVTVNVDTLLPPCQPPCGVPTYYDQTLTANTTITGTTIVIGKTLVVPAGLKLTISGSQVNFTQSGKILVNPGGKLEITDSKLSACDDSRSWKGLVIKGDNTDAAQFTITGSSIADAAAPISMHRVINPLIEANYFDSGDTAIKMVKCAKFAITKNQFSAYSVGIHILKTVASEDALIKENTFTDVKTAVLIEKGNNSTLTIKCNTFNNYADYAIYSDSTTLKTQGTTLEGAGNLFISNSTKINHKLRHNGNAINYYYDPSDPVNLVTGTGMSATAVASANDGSCGTPAARLGNGNTLAGDADVSVSAKPNEIDFKAFPNPFTDQLTIVYQLPVNCKGGTARIYEAASGKLIFESVLNSNQSKLLLQNFNIAAGLYICHIIADDGTSKQFKLVNMK